MNVAMSYLGVVLIWSTTPLAMKWSTEEVGFLFGVTSRMGIGAAVAILLCVLLKKPLPTHAPALKTYLVTGLGAYFAMSCAYWSAQYIPSGWISVIFGISPLLTSLIAAVVLGEKSVSVLKTSALLLSLAGLYVMFQQGLGMGTETVYGIAAAMAGALFHAIGIVAVKQINADIEPVSTMTGTLLVAIVLYSVTWMVGDFETPVVIPTRTAASILYLGLIGSVLGFMLFFYVLKHVEATRAALITLITPVSALLLGNLLNNEPLTRDIILGTGLVIAGLLIFQYGHGLRTYSLRRLLLNTRVRPGTLSNID